MNYELKIRRLIHVAALLSAAIFITGCAAGALQFSGELTLVSDEDISKSARATDVKAEAIQTIGKSKKYVKGGITVVYLEGSPSEIGYTHGKLLQEEIIDANGRFMRLFEELEPKKRTAWMGLVRKLEERIPEEYIEEMRGISRGSGIAYEKILFLNTLTTVSMHTNCFAVAFRNEDSRILTFRQIDNAIDTDMYKNMVLFIMKPDKGYAFAAILIPGWVDGESGLNEDGLTVFQNNILIKQTNWEIMPITHLSRLLLQYSKTIDDVDRLLGQQNSYPARLLFVSTPLSASVFELANGEKARLDMDDRYLVLSNHARRIPSRNISGNSQRRLDHGNEFLEKHVEKMDIQKGIQLLRTSRISSSLWNGFQNRQSFVFSPSTLDFWIALPPDSSRKAASLGPYVGFNLKNELYGENNEISPAMIRGGG